MKEASRELSKKQPDSHRGNIESKTPSTRYKIQKDITRHSIFGFPTITQPSIKASVLPILVSKTLAFMYFIFLSKSLFTRFIATIYIIDKALLNDYSVITRTSASPSTRGSILPSISLPLTRIFLTQVPPFSNLM